jgi:O-succinylhomoserine sulfhydrylase
VVGGAVLGSRALIREQVLPVLRTTGPSLAPFNAWVLLKGLETLALRMRAQSAAAQQLAEWLERQPGVARVHYPGLASHPQAELAARQQTMAGAVLAFELDGDGPEDQRARAWRLIDGTRVMSITANLGDTRTTITHPATTTHGRLTPEARARAGITEGLVRIAVGLEAIADLQSDLAGALAS